MNRNNNKPAQLKAKRDNAQVTVTTQPVAEVFVPGPVPGVDDPVEATLTADTGFVPLYDPLETGEFETGEAAPAISGIGADPDMAAQNGSFPRLHSAFQYPYL